MKLLRNRCALSTVVTTLIILVVSVLIAGVVTYFAINVTSTRVQEENLALTKLHVWVPGDSPTDTEAAFAVTNTGGRDVVINKITVRGQSAVIPPKSDQDVVYATTNHAISKDLDYIAAVSTGWDVVQIDSNSANDVTLQQATGDITLKSGYCLIVYVSKPDSITVNDIGITVGITVFTSQAMYYQEANVQGYTTGSS